MSLEIKPGEDKKEEEPSGLKVGDKTYTPQDVEQILAQQNILQTSLSELDSVKQAVSRYGIDPQTFVINAEGAFSVMSKLLDEGVIDNQGNVIGKKEGVGKIEGGQGIGGETFIPPKVATNNQGPDSVALAALEMLTQKLDAVSKTVESIDKTQSSIIRTNLEEKLRSKYPVLGPDDTSRVIATALRDRSKDVFTHAENFANAKTVELARLREEHAKEFGVDLKSFDENKIVDPGNDGGVSTMLKGRKISFRNIKGQETITPSQAIKDFMKMRFKGV